MHAGVSILKFSIAYLCKTAVRTNYNLGVPEGTQYWGLKRSCCQRQGV